MNNSLDTYRELGRKIEELIRPGSFPLAVKLVKSESEIQPEYKRPARDLGFQNFVCQNFKMCRSYGWTMALTQQDINCRAARLVYGWDTITEEAAKTESGFDIGLYANDPETSRKLAEHIYGLNNAFEALVISPLTRTKVVPDVVMIYCLPAQAMRFIQGYLYFEGGVLEFTAAGRIGSCHEGVAKTFLTKKPQLAVLGNGDRIWGGAQDSEVMFACPREKLEVLIKGLEKTHQAGLRYPVPAYMNFPPGFQKSFEKKALERAGGTLIKE